MEPQELLLYEKDVVMFEFASFRRLKRALRAGGVAPACR